MRRVGLFLVVGVGWCDQVYSPTYICDDGTILPPIRLQMKSFLDISAFPDADAWKQYRSDFVQLMSDMFELEGDNHFDFDLAFYSFNNKRIDDGEGWCGDLSVIFDYGRQEALNALDAVWKRVPSPFERPQSGVDATTPYSSLQDVMYHALLKDDWVRTGRDEDGKLVVRFLHVATDTLPWSDDAIQTVALPPSDEEDVFAANDPWDYCKSVNYASPLQTSVAAGRLPDDTYYHFLTQEGPDVLTKNVSQFFSTDYATSFLGGAEIVWSDQLPVDGGHVSLTYNRIKEAMCKSAAKVAFMVCPNGEFLPPIRLQFTEFLDVAAFPENNEWSNYRCELVDTMKHLFGQEANHRFDFDFAMYSFDNKWRGNGQGWCGDLEVRFSDAKHHSMELVNAVWLRVPNVFVRPLTDIRTTLPFSSLQDNIYHSLMRNDWIRTERDADGKLVVRFLHVATDTSVWGGGASKVEGGQASSDFVAKSLDVVDYCQWVDYADWEHTSAAAKAMPAATYYHFLTKNIPGVDDYNVTEYFSQYPGTYLGGTSKYWSDALPNEARHMDLTLARVKEAMCTAAVKQAPYICDDGRRLPAVHLQFAAFLDLGAFPNDNEWGNYRYDLERLAMELYDMEREDFVFDFSLYNFVNKGADGEYGWCGSVDVLMENSKSKAQEKFYELWLEFPNAMERTLSDSDTRKQYSSLQDVMYHSLLNDGWNRAEKDGSGRTIVRMLHVASDTAAWAGGAASLVANYPDVSESLVMGASDPSIYCHGHDYPWPDQTSRAASKFGEQTFYHFLTKQGPVTPEGDMLKYYSVYPKVHLNNPKKLYVDLLPSGGWHRDVTFNRIKESICEAVDEKFDIMRCNDGRVLSAVRLQWAVMLDLSSFADENAWKNYRTQMVDVINELYLLQEAYNLDFDFSFYSFTNKVLGNGEGWCGDRDVRFGDKLEYTMSQLDYVWGRALKVLKRPLTDADPSKDYSSLQDNMYHALLATDWKRGDDDGYGRQVVRVIQVVTDTLPWDDDASMTVGLPKSDRNAVGSSKDPYDYCTKVNYPARECTSAEASKMPKGTYYHFLTDSGHLNFFGNEYPDQFLGQAQTFWADLMPEQGRHKLLTKRRLNEAMCERLKK